MSRAGAGMWRVPRPSLWIPMKGLLVFWLIHRLKLILRPIDGYLLILLGNHFFFLDIFSHRIHFTIFGFFRKWASKGLGFPTSPNHLEPAWSGCLPNLSSSGSSLNLSSSMSRWQGSNLNPEVSPGTLSTFPSHFYIYYDRCWDMAAAGKKSNHWLETAAGRY